MALKSVERRVDELELNKQDTLVSGVTIKTINGNSVLGSGNLVISPSSTITVGTTPVTSGTDGRVFFQSGGVVQQDANFFWDNTNKRLGIGTSTPNDAINIVGYNTFVKIDGNSSTDRSVAIGATSNGTGNIFLYNGSNSNSIYITGNGTSFFNGGNVGIGTTSPAARLDVRAQGALSTDIAFRVRNSADTQNSFQIDGLGQGRIKSTGFTPRFAIGYDWFGSDRNAFVFTQNIQNFRGQEWTFDAGYGGTFEGLRIFNDLTGNNQGLFTIQLNNYCFGTQMLNTDTGTAERRVLRIANGVAPTTSKADEFKFYSSDIVAGNAAPHFRTEAGDIVKLFKGAALTASDGTLANAVTRIAELEARLQAAGLIA